MAERLRILVGAAPNRVPVLWLVVCALALALCAIYLYALLQGF